MVLVLIVGSLFLFFGCLNDKNDGPTPTTSTYDLDAVKAYSYFKIGTYWVYRDTTIGVEDCVYVTSDVCRVDTVIKNGQTQYLDYYNVEMSRTYNTHKYMYWMAETWAIQYGETPVWKDRWGGGVFASETFLLVHPFALYQSYRPYTSYGIVSMHQWYDSLNISNHNYRNVVKFNDTEDNTEDKSETNFYIAKNIGVIRKEILDSAKVWDLVRYKIVQ